MLRVIADFGRKHRRNFKLIGVDANEFIVNYAKEKTVKYPEIDYFSQNVFSKEFDGCTFKDCAWNPEQGARGDGDGKTDRCNVSSPGGN